MTEPQRHGRIGQSGWDHAAATGMMSARKGDPMRAGGSRWRADGGKRGRRPAAALAAPAVAVLLLAGLAAGCSAKGSAATKSSPSPNGSATPSVASTLPATASHGKLCGTTKTAVNVPIKVYLAHSHDCATAMKVQEDYTKAIKDGSAPGNGGGGPVKIDGWTCRGFATPIVLQTGQASKCQHGPAVILAILPPPTASATP
jgi:hypothetical protein